LLWVPSLPADDTRTISRLQLYTSRPVIVEGADGERRRTGQPSQFAGNNPLEVTDTGFCGKHFFPPQ
jgi:hypothetical protein